MIDAATTLNQLANAANGMHRLHTMIGAKNFTISAEGNYVAFKFMRGAKNKANYIKITLDASDTYSVEFGYIHGLSYTVRSLVTGYYDDMLAPYFMKETGLALSI